MTTAERLDDDTGPGGRWWDGYAFACVYRTIYKDTRLATVVEDDAMLGAWLHLLLTAEKTWPEPAPIPRRTDPDRLAHLVKVGVIELQPHDCFTFHGLDLEREYRWTKAARGGQARAATAPRDHGRFAKGSTSAAPAALDNSTSAAGAAPASLDNSTSAAPATYQQGTGTATERGTGTERARVPAFSESGPWAPFASAWAARGLAKAPTPKQREALWDAVDNYPTASARWVADAPPNVAVATIVGYILDQYHARRNADGAGATR